MAFNEALTIRGEPTVCEREDNAVFRRVTIDVPAWKITTFTTFIHSTCLHKHLEKGTQTHIVHPQRQYIHMLMAVNKHTYSSCHRDGCSGFMKNAGCRYSCQDFQGA